MLWMCDCQNAAEFSIAAWHTGSHTDTLVSHTGTHWHTGTLAHTGTHWHTGTLAHWHTDTLAHTGTLACTGTHWHTDTLAHCDTLWLHAAWVTLVSPITVWVSSIDPRKTKKTKLGPKSRKNMKCWVEAKPGNYIWWPAAGFVGNKGDSRSQLLLKVWEKTKNKEK